MAANYLLMRGLYDGKRRDRDNKKGKFGAQFR